MLKILKWLSETYFIYHSIKIWAKTSENTDRQVSAQEQFVTWVKANPNKGGLL